MTRGLSLGRPTLLHGSCAGRRGGWPHPAGPADGRWLRQRADAASCRRRQMRTTVKPGGSSPGVRSWLRLAAWAPTQWRGCPAGRDGLHELRNELQPCWSCSSPGGRLRRRAKGGGGHDGGRSVRTIRVPVVDSGRTACSAGARGALARRVRGPHLRPSLGGGRPTTSRPPRTGVGLDTRHRRRENRQPQTGVRQGRAHSPRPGSAPHGSYVGPER